MSNTNNEWARKKIQEDAGWKEYGDIRELLNSLGTEGIRYTGAATIEQIQLMHIGTLAQKGAAKEYLGEKKDVGRTHPWSCLKRWLKAMADWAHKKSIGL